MSEDAASYGAEPSKAIVVRDAYTQADADAIWQKERAALDLAAIDSLDLDVPEYRALAIKRLKTAESLILADLVRRRANIPAGVLPTTLGILRDKIDNLEGTKPTAIGQQVNIQINGDVVDRGGLLARLGSVSRGKGSPLDCLGEKPADATSTDSPGEGPMDTALATVSRRGRGRPKGSRNKPKANSLTVNDTRGGR